MAIVSRIRVQLDGAVSWDLTEKPLAAVEKTAMDTPGMCARHAIVTNNCREMRGDDGAFDEVVQRMRGEYDRVCEGRGREEGLEIHFAMIVQLPRHRKPSPSPEPE